MIVVKQNPVVFAFASYRKSVICLPMVFVKLFQRRQLGYTKLLEGLRQLTPLFNENNKLLIH